MKKNQQSLIKRKFIGTIIFFIVMAGVAFTYNKGITSLVKTSDWVAHTHRVISFGNLIQKLLIDMETGERGFLITGKNNFLEPYENGKEEYVAVMSYTKNLVSDNPSQVHLLEKIDTLVNKWQETAALPEINIRREMDMNKTSFAAVNALIANETGKAVMDELRVQLSKFKSTEEKLLAQRRDDSKKAAKLSVLLAFVGTFAATVIGLLILSMTFRTPTSAFFVRNNNSLLKAQSTGGQDGPSPKNVQYVLFVQIIIVLVLIISPVVYVLNNAVEATDIIEGSGYGVDIGASKLSIFERLSKLKADRKIYGIRVGDDKNFDKLFTELSKNNFHILKHYNEWYVEYNVNRVGMDTMQLSFVDDQLQKISKHYQAVVLPDFIQNMLYGE